MATQRLTIATLAGHAAAVAAARFEAWRTAADPATVDRLCGAIREHALSLPVVYFAEWVDRWLMGNLVPGPRTVHGERFEATCLTPEQAVAWADQCVGQFAEQDWLAARLREAAAGWGDVSPRYAVVVMRETFGPSASDDDVRATLDRVPDWLLPLGERGASAP